MNLQKPYWVAPLNELPSWDFNREIVMPGENKNFPDGAVGVRADDDFWAVAALPLADYINRPIEEIVAELWPECPHPRFEPDSPRPTPQKDATP